MEHVVLTVLDVDENVVGYDILCDDETFASLKEYFKSENAVKES